MCNVPLTLHWYSLRCTRQYWSLIVSSRSWHTRDLRGVCQVFRRAVFLCAHKSISHLLSRSRHSIHRPTSRIVASENVSDNASSSYSTANPTNYSIIRQHTDDASCTLHTAKAACVQALLYSKYDRKSTSQRQSQRLVDISLAYSLHRKPGRNVRHPSFGASENFLRLALSPLCNLSIISRISSLSRTTSIDDYVLYNIYILTLEYSYFSLSWMKIHLLNKNFLHFLMHFRCFIDARW